MDETQKTGPTPGPWKTGSSVRDAVFDANGQCIADCEASQGGRLVDIANAAHIVKCVNERPALIAERDRLREIVAMFFDRVSRHGDWDDGCFYYNRTSAPELQEPLRRARAALGEGK